MNENYNLVTPWTIIISASVLIGLFFSINIFFQKKGNRKSNMFLSLFLLTITTLLFSNFIVISNIYMSYPHLIGISFLLWYLLPPFFYFYVKTGIYPQYKFTYYDLLHLLPFAYMLIDVFPFYLISSELKLQWYQNYLAQPKSLSFSSAFIIIYSFSYLSACYYLLINFRKNYKKEFANTRLEHLNGIKRLLLVYTIYKVLDLVGMAATFISAQETIDIIQYISISLTIFIFVICYTYIKQPEFLFPTKVLKTKYKTSSLSETDLSKYSADLYKAMDEKKLYLDSEIKLSTLAEILNISSHTLSQVINQHLKMNFYDFINKFRVEEVKARLLNDESKNLTILAVAFESGFNSKSSFNKIFKKHVGKSPTEFIKENGISEING